MKWPIAQRRAHITSVTKLDKWRREECDPPQQGQKYHYVNLGPNNQTIFNLKGMAMVDHHSWLKRDLLGSLQKSTNRNITRRPINHVTWTHQSKCVHKVCAYVNWWDIRNKAWKDREGKIWKEREDKCERAKRSRTRTTKDESRRSRREQLEERRVKGRLYNQGSGEHKGDGNHRRDQRDYRLEERLELSEH